MNAETAQGARRRAGARFPRLALVFRRPLEAEFERATVRSRRLRFWRVGCLQLVMTHLGAIGLYALIQDAGVVLLATLAVDVFSLGCIVILRSRPGVFLRESVMMAGVLAWVVMAEWLSLYADQSHLWIIQTAIALQPFLMAAGIQLRFPYCVVGCLLTVACVVVGNALFSHAAPAEQFWMALVQTVAVAYALFGCWRLEERERMNYLAIRESQRNARELDRVNAHLARLTNHDELTGVLNRRGLRSAVAATPPGQSRAIVLVDVDYFKSYNDHYGHLAGDACLSRVAACLAENLARTGDTVARWGGEEFLVTIATGSAAVCAERAEAMCRCVRDMKIEHAASPIGSTVSISAGYALAQTLEPARLDELVQRADQALYAAKQAGRNRVHGAARPAPAYERRHSGHA